MTGDRELQKLARESIRETDSDMGYYAGYRAAQAKGTLCHGMFTSSGRGAALSSAAHLQQGAVTPVTVRFSNSATDPMRPDGALDVRGMSVAFHLPAGQRTDLIALRMSRFFVGTAHQFVWWQRAMRRNRLFGLPVRPRWLRLLYYIARRRLPPFFGIWQLAGLKRVPSYAACHYNSLHAFRLVSNGGGPTYARYSWMPGEPEKTLHWWQTRGRPPDYLRDELASRIAGNEPVRFRLDAVIAGAEDPVDDASAPWGKGGQTIPLGVLELTGMGAAAAMGKPPLVFEPTRMTDGIELPDGDDLLALRKHVYALSAMRRREVHESGGGSPCETPPIGPAHDPDGGQQPEAPPGAPDERPPVGGVVGRVAADGDKPEIYYETGGDPSGRPLMLIMGFGCPMTWWGPDFLALFLERNFYVIRFDNRDCGKSQRCGGKQSRVLGTLFPRGAAKYNVDDMAGDAVRVLDELGLKAVHVMGISLGGMIAQSLAIKHTGRVLSLTSLASTPAFRSWPPKRAPRFKVTARLLWLNFFPGRSLAKHVKRSLPLWRMLNASHFVFEEAHVRGHIERAWEWSGGADPYADLRQTAAVRISPDRAPALGMLQRPTVVVHGSADPLVRVEGGLDTAQAVRGAKWVPIEGMGHYTPHATWELIVDQVDEVARRAESGAPV